MCHLASCLCCGDLEMSIVRHFSAHLTAWQVTSFTRCQPDLGRVDMKKLAKTFSLTVYGLLEIISSVGRTFA